MRCGPGKHYLEPETGADTGDLPSYEYFFRLYVIVGVSMVLHGLYDTMLKKEMNSWALVIALCSIGVLAFQISRLRGEDGCAGKCLDDARVQASAQADGVSLIRRGALVRAPRQAFWRRAIQPANATAKRAKQSREAMAGARGTLVAPRLRIPTSRRREQEIRPAQRRLLTRLPAESTSSWENFGQRS
jgi:hypothetical protein